MGSVVTFSNLPYRQTTAGVKRASITGPEMKEMSAEVITLAPGATLAESVAAGSDFYFYTLAGAVTVGGAETTRRVEQDSFVTVSEGTALTVTNPGGDEATLVGVQTPPAHGSAALAGFSGSIAVAARAATPVHAIPAELKRRIYFAGKEAARTERAHAMIVLYEKDTVTGIHMHPNAESMFVFLSGKIRFTVNGEDVIVGRGQATYFPTSDRHGLRVAEGDEVSFLEFHVPAAFTTVRG